MPGLTPTTVLTTQNRASGNLVGASTTISNTIPARIFQVATSQSPTGTQQVSIGQQNQKILQANVMTLPIIVNNNRITHTVKTPLQQGLIAHVSKLASGSVSNDGTIINNSITTTIPSNTMVASIQANQSNSASTIQVSQGSMQSQQSGSYTSQSQVNQGGSQIITVSQQQPQQLISNQGNIHQGGQTVVPLQITQRAGNIPIKTITVSTSNAGSLDGNIHRNLSGSNNLQATTIMPIAKLVSQQQQQNIATASQSGNQSTPVFIHTRIPAPSSVVATQASQVVSTQSSSTPGGFSSNSATVYYEPASVSIAPSLVASSEQNKTTTSTASNNESFTIVSGPSARYSDKMMNYSIIASSFQQQNNQPSSSSANTSTVRYSPLVVENQSQPSSVGVQNQSQPHQIITMSSGAHQIIQQGSQMSQQQPQGMSVESILASIPSSPHASLRKNETTPVKMTKKVAKVRLNIIFKLLLNF